MIEKMVPLRRNNIAEHAISVKMALLWSGTIGSMLENVNEEDDGKWARF